MGRAMKAMTTWLRLRLALRAMNPAALAAVLLCAAGSAALAWIVPARAGLEQERADAQRAARLPPPVVAPPAAGGAAIDNLALFRAALGRQAGVEPQLATLFRIAARTGLVLRQGEYKRGFERKAQLHTYQIDLPVKGSYAQVWQFALQALRAIPHAALDDISFKRDSIGEAAVEARLRFTLYLADAPGAPR
jgi:hypothetical protein